MKAKKLGIAKGVDYLSLNWNGTRQTILKVLENTSYATNAKMISAKFRDQKEHPLERAMWWIEWLIRNPDSGHYMKSPVFRLGFIAGNSYDVVAFAILCIALSLILSFKIFGYCIIWVGRCFQQARNNSPHKKLE